MSVVRFATVDEVEPLPLTPAEQARAERFRRPEDHDSYRAAHWLVRHCVAELLGADVSQMALAQRCPTCGGSDHGAPYVVGHADVHVSLSHTATHVAAVAARVRCGIDVETLRPVQAPDQSLTAAERTWAEDQPDRSAAFLRLWTRKEALVKAGLLTLDDLTGHDARTPHPAAAVQDWHSPTAVGAWALR